jgi:hypothetical protein
MYYVVASNKTSQSLPGIGYAILAENGASFDPALCLNIDFSNFSSVSATSKMHFYIILVDHCSSKMVLIVGKIQSCLRNGSINGEMSFSEILVNFNFKTLKESFTRLISYLNGQKPP